MRNVVVTSFSPQGQALYGDRCVQSLRQHWRSDVVVYADAPTTYEGVEVRLTADIPGWAACRPTLPRENHRAEKPTNYIWDAQRFAVKPFVWYDAAQRLGTGLLTWIDGDTLTTTAVPVGLPAYALQDADVAYLGRGPMHPETGLLVFRIPEALPLLSLCRDLYGLGHYATLLDGWTDCHVLRACLMAAEARDLTTALYSGVWTSKVDAMALSPFGPYVTHFKGTARKQALAHA